MKSMIFIRDGQVKNALAFDHKTYSLNRILCHVSSGKSFHFFLKDLNRFF